MEKYFFYTLLIIIAAGCSPRIMTHDASVNFLSAVDGTITLRAIGEGSNKNSVASAQQKVITALLFRGIPESPEKFPLIGTSEGEEKAKHPEYFNSLYDGQRYKSFISSTIPTTSVYRESGSRKTAFDIKVNVNALRSDLEANKIIRKFGY